MTDTQVAALRRGNTVHERQATGCIRLIVTSDPVARIPTHHECWATSLSGQYVIRVTCNAPDVHLAAECSA